MNETVVLVTAAVALVAGGIGVAVLRPHWVVDHARWMLAVHATISVGALAALIQVSPLAVRIQVDPSEEPLLPRGDPAQDVYDEAILNFGDDDLYVIVMETDDVFTAESLGVLRRVTDRISRLDGVRGVESLVDVFSYHYDPEFDWVEVGRFIDSIPRDRIELANLRDRALDDPIYSTLLVSRDGRAAALNVSFQAMTDREFIEAGTDERILDILEQESAQTHRFYVTGRRHIKTQGYHIMIADLLRLNPLAILFAAGMLWLLTSSIRTVILTLSTCTTAALWVFGILALLEHPLNLITLVLAPLLISIGSVYTVHVIARFEALALERADARTAALECLILSRMPVLIAAMTTVIGFVALMIANIPAINDLGLFASLGMGFVSFLGLTGVPAVLALLPLPRQAGWLASPEASGSRLASGFSQLVDDLLVRISELTVRRPTRVLASWAVVTAVAVAMIPRIEIDTDYLTFFRTDSDVRKDFRAVNEMLAGTVPIYFILSGDEPGTFREPENLTALMNLRERVAEVPGVSATVSVIDFLQVIRSATVRNPEELDPIPETRAEIAEYLFMVPKDKLRRFANSNHSRVNLLVRTGELGSSALKDLKYELTKLADDGILPQELDATITGSAFLLNRGADRIAGNQIATVAFAALSILILISWVFQSPRVGLLAMVPNVVPVLVFFGALGAGVAPLSLPTSLIGCVALGIAVDDTVHFLVSYRRVRASGASTEEATLYCLRHVGRPILVTSLILCLGFCALLASGFATLQEFGQLTAMTMLICLSTDLLLLPAILVRARI